MPEPFDHVQKPNPLEAMLRRIPGFQGYFDRENRRQSDALQRDWLAQQLQRSKRGLDELARRWTEAGRIERLPELERLRNRLERLIGRIRGAMAGYSGFFDLVQIDNARLDRIYDHDIALAEEVEALAKVLEGLPEQSQQPDPLIAQAFDLVDQIDGYWDKREDLLQGFE